MNWNRQRTRRLRRRLQLEKLEDRRVLNGIPIAVHDAREHAGEDIHRGAPRVDQTLRLRE